MKKILVSGLINTETTVKVRKFPIEYYPIDYPFFGVNTRVSGVAYNLAKALTTLGDDVQFVTMTGNDFGASYVKSKIEEIGVSTQYVKSILKETPSSVVLYDEEGRRQIYCDLKDIHDEYNQEFMEHANILFLSDENIKSDYREFLMNLENTYGNDIIVLGMGAKGALMYVKEENKFYELPAVTVGEVVNTVGAGDALFSSFVHYYAKGVSPVEALKRAQIFASYKIGFDGASNGFPNEEIIEKLFEKEY